MWAATLEFFNENYVPLIARCRVNKRIVVNHRGRGFHVMFGLTLATYLLESPPIPGGVSKEVVTCVSCIHLLPMH